MLDGFLTEQGDAPAATQALIDQVLARFTPALAGPGGSLTRMLVLVLDPLSFEAIDPEGPEASYDLGTEEFENTFDDAFVDVSGNVEVVVLPNPGPTLTLNVDDVPATARALVVSFDASGSQVLNLTEPVRSGQTTFTITTSNLGP